jgi:hypothetical protein
MRLFRRLLMAATETVNPVNTRCRLCGADTGGGGALCGSCVTLP